MGQVKLEIGGRSFMVTCQDGEESHLGKLAAMVSEKAGEAGDPAGLTESRMLLFTSLLLADELHASKKTLKQLQLRHLPLRDWRMKKPSLRSRNWRKEQNPSRIALSRPKISPR